MQQSIKVREQAHGVAYTLGETTVVFRYGDTVQLVIGEAVVPVDDPGRFGYTHTPKARREWLRRFVAALR